MEKPEGSDMELSGFLKRFFPLRNCKNSWHFTRVLTVSLAKKLSTMGFVYLKVLQQSSILQEDRCKNQRYESH